MGSTTDIDDLILTAEIFIGLENIRTSPGQLRENKSLVNMQLVYTAEILYYTIQGVLKFSLLSFYWRLFSSTSLRYSIYGGALLAFLWASSAVRGLVLVDHTPSVNYMREFRSSQPRFNAFLSLLHGIGTPVEDINASTFKASSSEYLFHTSSWIYP